MLRGSRAGAGGREFAGFGSVDGGVRGIFLVEIRSFEHGGYGSRNTVRLPGTSAETHLRGPTEHSGLQELRDRVRRGRNRSETSLTFLDAALGDADLFLTTVETARASIASFFCATCSKKARARLVSPRST